LGILAKKNLLEVIQNEQLKQALIWIEEFCLAGGNSKYLLEQLLESLRTLLLSKNGIETDQDVIADLTLSEISLLIRLFSEAYNSLKTSPIESLPLEIAVVDFYNRRHV
jgi:DNA polymerase-3 subunit gamma/tau